MKTKRKTMNKEPRPSFNLKKETNKLAIKNFDHLGKRTQIHKESITDYLEDILFSFIAQNSKKLVVENLARQVVKMALDGDKDMIKLLFSYVDGLPKSKTKEVNNNLFINMSEEELKAKAIEIKGKLLKK